MALMSAINTDRPAVIAIKTLRSMTADPHIAWNGVLIGVRPGGCDPKVMPAIIGRARRLLAD
jgi:hypothetical protein